MAGALDGEAALVTGAGKSIGRPDRAEVEAVAGEITAMGGRAVPTSPTFPISAQSCAWRI